MGGCKGKRISRNLYGVSELAAIPCSQSVRELTEIDGQAPRMLFNTIGVIIMIKTFISCYRTPGPQKGFRRGF